MASLSRRAVLRLGGGGLSALAAAGAVDATAAVAEAAAPGALAGPPDAIGMLYDATLCIGCKTCVTACSGANGLVPQTALGGGLWQMPTDLDAHTKNVIKLWDDPATGAFSFVKRQCMHCFQAACVAGCPFHALSKGEKGIVAWDPERCIGCRYCEVACPFQVPKFEWDRFNPKVVKCEFCRHRLGDGGQPACTEVCPTHAVVFGSRAALLEEAKARVAASPGKYHEDRVYGESDAGGLQVLYLSHVPFERLGLPDVGPAPVRSSGHPLSGILAKLVALPVLLYGGFLFFIRRSWKRHDEEARRLEAEAGLKEQL